MSSGAPAALVEAASACYRDAGRFAWHFARAKLRGDPVFTAILAGGLLAGREQVLDLGCGQGLLAAWLAAAQAVHAARDPSNAPTAGAQPGPGGWPRGWPAPPHLGAYTGIELNPREAARARAACAQLSSLRALIVQGDVRHVDYAAADAIVMLDVLHYIDRQSHEIVLRKARAALAPGGTLLLRVGDAGGGLRFALSRLVDSAVAVARRGRWVPLHCRSRAEWLELLSRAGFSARALPLSGRTLFANVLLLGCAV